MVYTMISYKKLWYHTIYDIIGDIWYHSLFHDIMCKTMISYDKLWYHSLPRSISQVYIMPVISHIWYHSMISHIRLWYHIQDCDITWPKVPDARWTREIAHCPAIPPRYIPATCNLNRLRDAGNPLSAWLGSSSLRPDSDRDSEVEAAIQLAHDHRLDEPETGMPCVFIGVGLLRLGVLLDLPERVWNIVQTLHTRTKVCIPADFADSGQVCIVCQMHTFS